MPYSYSTIVVGTLGSSIGSHLVWEHGLRKCTKDPNIGESARAGRSLHCCICRLRSRAVVIAQGQVREQLSGHSIDSAGAAASFRSGGLHAPWPSRFEVG